MPGRLSSTGSNARRHGGPLILRISTTPTASGSTTAFEAGIERDPPGSRLDWDEKAPPERAGSHP
jgi:hypothetical protein